MLTEDTWKFGYLTEISVMPCFSLKSNERLRAFVEPWYIT